jgi:hypothetical protein
METQIQTSKSQLPVLPVALPHPQSMKNASSAVILRSEATKNLQLVDSHGSRFFAALRMTASKKFSATSKTTPKFQTSDNSLALDSPAAPNA